MKKDQIPISVVLYQEGGLWIAQGLQYDIVARGSDPVEASDRFNQKFGAELIMSVEIGDAKPLSSVPKAPKEFWTMYETAKMRVDIDEPRIQVADGQTLRIHPHIKLTNERHKDAA